MYPAAYDIKTKQEGVQQQRINLIMMHSLKETEATIARHVQQILAPQVDTHDDATTRYRGMLLTGWLHSRGWRAFIIDTANQDFTGPPTFTPSPRFASY
jgi:hypothetical protein